VLRSDIIGFLSSVAAKASRKRGAIARRPLVQPSFD
jgi:hypothetical protein